MKELLKSWWKWLRYSPNDPQFNAGGVIKIAVIGGGTGMPKLLRGLKKYSKHISAIVTVCDSGGSAGIMRKEFDMLAPGDVRRCISALSDNEELISKLFEYRFDKNSLAGHTLGNIWITGLNNYFGSFEKAIEVTTELFKGSGQVLPSTLDNVDVMVDYEDGTTECGEDKLDEIMKKIKRVYLSKPKVNAYDKAVMAITSADLIVIGPGSLYGSIIPNLIVPGIRNAIINNQKAVKIYISNCSTERTQTAGYSVADHIEAIEKHVNSKKFFDYCLVNDRIIKQSKDDTKLGEVNNITTDADAIGEINVYKANVISEENPLVHDSEKLAKAVIDLYNKIRKQS